MKGEVQFRNEKLAVLIDADNTSHRIIINILKEIAKLGTANVKRIYGDWTNPNMNSWKDVLNEAGIVPIQQFSYTTGKNSTDNALIIDAMDLLYTEKFDGFCIISSDSDFTRLAHRIRQSGLLVYGFGKLITPKAFVNACDRFIHTEILGDTQTIISENNEKSEQTSINSANQTETKIKPLTEIYEILKEAFDDLLDDGNNNNNWVNIGNFGQQLLKLDSSFDSRNYGYKRLGLLLKATDLFEIKDNNIKLKN